MRLLLAATVALTGCTWVSDAQYDDRVEELEEGLEEFLPAVDEVQFIAAAGSKFYWVYKMLPNDDLVMMVHDTTTGMNKPIQLGFELSDPTRIQEDFFFSNELVVRCSSGIRAWSAADGTLLQMTSSGTVDGITDNCAVDGNTITTVFSSEGDIVYQWQPGPSATPVRKMDLNAAGIADNFSITFGALGDKLLVVESGLVWHVDLTAQTAVWLGNDDLPAQGLVVFDERAAMFDSTQGVKYVELAEQPVIQSFDDLIADGGYHLNSKRGDIHLLDDDGNYFLYKRYVIYRGNSGIFAYNLDTRKVTDLLLDHSDRSTIYRGATMTDTGVLFVQHRDGFNSSTKEAVYKIDLKTRLP